MLVNSVVINKAGPKNFVNLVNIKKWYGIIEVQKKRRYKLMEDKEFLIKKVEILESAIKQIAVIQYELSEKLGELEGTEYFT